MPLTRKMALRGSDTGTSRDATPTTTLPSTFTSTSPSTSMAVSPSSAPSVPATVTAAMPNSPPASASDLPELPKEPRLLWRRRQDEELHLECQWLLCSFTTWSMQEFNIHVSKHVPVCLDPVNMYERCHWANCTFHGTGESEMKLHVLYHAFHTKLMALGTNVKTRNKLQECRLDADERHVLPDLETYVCAWEECTIEFNDPQSFFWHVEHHVNCHYLGEELDKDQLLAKCLWEGCTRRMPNYHRLREHMRVHTQEKKVACPNCGIVFSNNQKFADHLRRQAPNENLRFQCSDCLRLFATERLLREHVRRHINNVRCQYCAITLRTPSDMRVHMLYKHSEERTFKCSKCPVKFKAATDLERHLERHKVAEKGEQFVCPHGGCRFVFSQPERLKSHFRRLHSGQPRTYYFCHLCEARYLLSQSLSKHLKKFHQLNMPEGHSRFRYRRGRDGHYRLQTMRYESLEVAEQAPSLPTPPAPAAGPSMPDVLALSCQEGDVPDTITTDDGRELLLPEQVRRGLATGRRVLVCVQGDEVQMLARMDAMDELRDPDDPDALVMVVDGQAVADGPAVEAP